MVDVLQDFKILLANPPSGSTYFPGTEVVGTLVVKVDEPKNYNDIVIYLTGKGHVHWTETRSTGTGDSRRTHTVDYTANETYVELQSIGWSKGPEAIVLPPGEYHYQFRYLIPPQSPSSFESRTGWIRYTLGAKISRPYPNVPHSLETKILVNEIIDTNAAQLRLQYRLQNQKTAGILCCQSGPITTIAEVPRTGYCIGEEIPFRVTVENGGSRPVRVTVDLHERVTYSAQGGHQYANVSHVVQGCEPVEPHRTLVWVPEVNVLKIPVTTPTTMRSSNIIQRTFFLTFNTLIPRVLFNPTLTIPLTVGNVPFNPDPPTATPGTYPPPAAVNPPPVSFALTPPLPLGLPLAPPPQAIPSVVPETVPKNPELTSSDPPTYQDAVTKY